MNGEWIRRLDLDELEAPRPAGRAGAIRRPARARRLPRSAAHRPGARRHARRARASRWTSSSSTSDDVRDRPGSRGSGSRRPSASARSSTPSSRTSRRASGRAARISTSVAVIEELGIKPRKAMPALYTAVEGRAAGSAACSTRSYLLGRERTLSTPRTPPATDSTSGRVTAAGSSFGASCSSSSLLAACLYYVVTFVPGLAGGPSATTRRRSQAIVVLGAAQYNGRPSPVFKARLDHAADAVPARASRR